MHLAAHQPGLAGTARPTPATELRRQPTRLGQLQQGTAARCPTRLLGRRREVHRYWLAGRRRLLQGGLACIRVPPQRRRAKGFSVNARIRHVHSAQPFIQVLSKAAWAAQVEIVVIQRQRHLHLLDAQSAGKLIILPGHGMVFWLAQGAMNVQQAASLLPQACQLLPEWQVGQAAGAME
ncbi:hypothetical protein D3C79_844730 [compost metagenome]